MHYGAAFVVFDVAHPSRFVKRNFFGEALLFEVSDGIVVRVGEEMLDWGSCFDVVFEMGHEMCSVAFDLLIGGDGAEDDFGEFSAVEGTICDSSGIL